MSIFALHSAKSFRQFRVAVLGVATFLRLAWAFLIALNAFSLTTQVDSTHQGVSIFVFAVDAGAFTFVVLVGLLESFKTRLAAYTSRVSFEVGWMTCFLILETAGATMFTILKPSFQCNLTVRINGDATGAVFASTAALSSTRPTTPAEATTCRTSNQIIFIGSWVAVGISLVYITYFLLLCRKAYKRDPIIWHQQVNKVDWSITSEPVNPPSPGLAPEMIQRPTNPHLSKDWNNDSMLSLPPVFVNPFEARKESFDSSVSSKKGLDRHQVMAQYQPPSFEPSFRPLVLPNMVHHQRDTTQSSFGGFSALGLEGMDRPATEYRKSRPTLSIHIPSQQVETVVPIGAADEDYDRIGRTMSAALVMSPMSQESFYVSEEPCAAIGRHMSMPLASPITDESGSSGSEASVAKRTNSSMKALASHVTLANGTPVSNDSREQVNAYTTNIPNLIQNVNAANGYPTVQNAPKRQSTVARQDSMTARRAMRFPPNGPPTSYVYQSQSSRSSGGILPLHNQDLPVTDGQYQRYYQSAPHSRSRSDGSFVQPSYEPQSLPLASSNSWPRQAYANQVPVQDVRRGPPRFHAPPPPNHSPVSYRHTRAAASISGSYEGSPMHTYQSHSRSSSTPSYHSQQALTAPMPALIQALHPVLRNSGNFQGFTPSPYQSRPSSAVRLPFFDDNANAFGPVRSAPQTPNSHEEMNVTITPELVLDTDKRKTKRSSKLRKSFPRNM